jgi:hypothetical protein
MADLNPTDGTLLVLIGHGSKRRIDSPKAMRDYVATITVLGDMELFDGPRVKRLKEKGDDPGGLSTSWMWRESGGQIHCWPERDGRIEIVLHSCKRFDPFLMEKFTRAHVRCTRLEAFDHSEDLRG